MDTCSINEHILALQGSYFRKIVLSTATGYYFADQKSARQLLKNGLMPILEPDCGHFTVV